jgi:hypothetical protein
MPPKSDPPHRHSEPAPKPRRKSRPKFELPAETESAAQDVGWVYRETREAKEPQKEPPVLTVIRPPERLLPAHEPAAEKSSTIAGFAIKAGIGVVSLGIVATGLMSLGILSVVSGPALLAVRLMQRN